MKHVVLVSCQEMGLPLPEYYHHVACNENVSHFLKILSNIAYICSEMSCVKAHDKRSVLVNCLMVIVQRLALARQMMTDVQNEVG